VLTFNDFDFIIIAISNASKDILQRNEAKKETMYERIEVEMRGVQQALYSSCTISTVPFPSEETELGDEPTQLRRIADATEARLRHVKEIKGIGHSGPKASTRGSHRGTSSCATREG
jgi:hypothetical protein